MTDVEKQILTNQMCILATLSTLGWNKLHPIQQENIQKRIQETKRIRDNKKRKNNEQIAQKNIDNLK